MIDLEAKLKKKKKRAPRKQYLPALRRQRQADF
jgi:hypothetical protein